MVFFAGDIGSISIALVIVFILFNLLKISKAPVILFLIIVYGADAIMTILYRKLILKEKITDPHRHHLYQKLVHVKQMPHLSVAVLYALVQLLLVGVAYRTYTLDFYLQCIIFTGFLIFFTLLYFVLYTKIIGKSMFKK